MCLINKRMLPMKLHYFLYLGGISSIVGFWPTIAKQLGYSPLVVGSMASFLSLIAFVVKPLAGFIVDKFPVKRLLFLSMILLCSLMVFAMNFVQKLPTETKVKFSCGTSIAVLNVCSNHDSNLPQCDDDLSKFLKTNTRPVTCQLLCHRNQNFSEEMCKSWNISDHCNTDTLKINDFDQLNTSLNINKIDEVGKNYVFEVESVQTKGIQVLWPICLKPVSTWCEISCSNDAIMQLATVPKNEGSIFSLHQFWMYFIVMSTFWIAQAITWSIQDPICFDLLGDKIEDFGKQRCWGSISWGLFSIFGGALVDYFSDSDIQKNYSPIYFLCLAITLCDFSLAYKIKIRETTGSKNTFEDIFKLFTKCNVIVYLVWILVMGICTSMVWNYLFWYMEEITSKYHSDKLPWIKTLQGLAIGIQCIGGEMPLFFFSGCIIKRLGHWQCMSLAMFVFGVRFYVYSIITNPIWILPVEFANGITFGLSFAVLMAYARIIAPPSAVSTVVGFAGALFEGVGISLGGMIGGYLYEKHGGSRTFQLFSYGSLTMCFLLFIFSKVFK